MNNLPDVDDSYFESKETSSLKFRKLVQIVAFVLSKTQLPIDKWMIRKKMGTKPYFTYF